MTRSQALKRFKREVAPSVIVVLRGKQIKLVKTLRYKRGG